MKQIINNSISIKNISHFYGSNQILKNTSLEIKSGEFFLYWVLLVVVKPPY